MNKPNSIYSAGDVSVSLIYNHKKLTIQFQLYKVLATSFEGLFIANNTKKNSVCLDTIYMVNFIFNVVLLPNFKFST